MQCLGRRTEQAEAGICSRSPQGTGLAPEPGNGEGASPTGGGSQQSMPGKRKEGNRSLSTLLLASSHPPGGTLSLPPRPRDEGGAGDDERGRKEAALLGELMGCEW